MIEAPPGMPLGIDRMLKTAFVKIVLAGGKSW